MEGMMDLLDMVIMLLDMDQQVLEDQCLDQGHLFTEEKRQEPDRGNKARSRRSHGHDVKDPAEKNWRIRDKGDLLQKITEISIMTVTNNSRFSVPHHPSNSNLGHLQEMTGRTSDQFLHSDKKPTSDHLHPDKKISGHPLPKTTSDRHHHNRTSGLPNLNKQISGVMTEIRRIFNADLKKYSDPHLLN